MAFFDNGELFGSRLRTLDVFLGDLIRQLEAGEDAIDRTGLAPHQQLQRPRRTRIEAGLLADDENRHLLELRNAFGVHIVEPLEVQIAKADDVAELAHLHPIEDAAAHIARALERVFAAAEHGDGVLARLEFFHEEAVLVVAQQVATDGRRIQMRSIEIDERLAELLGGRFVHTLCRSALEGLVDLAIGQVQPTDGAVAGQLSPTGRLVNIRAHQRRLLPRLEVVFDQTERRGDLVGRAHDDLVDHHHGHRRTGHRVDRHRTLIAGTPHHHALIGLDAGVLQVEIVQFLLRNADEQDRLVVLEHVGVDDHALRIEQHLHIDRLAGVGRDLGDVDALVGVAIDGAHTVGERSHLILAFRLGDVGSFREKLLDSLLLNGVVLGLRLNGTESHGKEHYEAVPP